LTWARHAASAAKAASARGDATIRATLVLAAGGVARNATLDRVSRADLEAHRGLRTGWRSSRRTRTRAGGSSGIALGAGAPARGAWDAHPTGGMGAAPTELDRPSACGLAGVDATAVTIAFIMGTVDSTTEGRLAEAGYAFVEGVPTGMVWAWPLGVDVLA